MDLSRRALFAALSLTFVLGYGFMVGVGYMALHQNLDGPVDWHRAFHLTLEAWTDD